MNCSWIEENLSDILDGLLTPEAEQELASHLDTCEVCAELLEQLREDQTVLMELNDVEVPRELIERVMRDVLPKPAKNPWKFFVPRLAPVAAALLVTVASYNMLPNYNMAKGTSEPPENPEFRIMSTKEDKVMSMQAAPEGADSSFTVSYGLSNPSKWATSSMAGGAVFAVWGAVVYYWYKKD